MIHWLSPHLLWGHVAHGSHDDPWDCAAPLSHRVAKFLRTPQLRQPEVENLEPPAAGYEKILRLQITVDDSFLVRSA